MSIFLAAKPNGTVRLLMPYWCVAVVLLAHYWCMAGVLLVYGWCITGVWLVCGCKLRTNPLAGRLDVVKVIITMTLTVTR